MPREPPCYHSLQKLLTQERMLSYYEHVDHATYPRAITVTCCRCFRASFRDGCLWVSGTRVRGGGGGVGTPLYLIYGDVPLDSVLNRVYNSRVCVLNRVSVRVSALGSLRLPRWWQKENRSPLCLPDFCYRFCKRKDSLSLGFCLEMTANFTLIVYLVYTLNASRNTVKYNAFSNASVLFIRRSWRVCTVTLCNTCRTL